MIRSVSSCGNRITWNRYSDDKNNFLSSSPQKKRGGNQACDKKSQDIQSALRQMQKRTVYTSVLVGGSCVREAQA